MKTRHLGGRVAAEEAGVFKDAWLVASKDLRIERRSRVLTNQLLPFTLVILIIFAFTFDTHPNLLVTLSPGLFWVASLFAMTIALQRSFSLEAENQARDGLLLYGLESAGIFLGKVVAIVIQSAIVELFIGFGIVILYAAPLHEVVFLALSAFTATLGISCVGVVFGAMVTGRSRDSLLPLLIFPVVAPVLLSATKAWEDYVRGKVSLGDPWLGLLVVFAIAFGAVGVLTFGSILEE
ncbi:MAG: heme exporter protein CcmB [Acidimicrobiales bacterium]